MRLIAMRYPPFLLAMALTGAGPAFIYANAAKLMGQWFPKEKTGLAIGAVLMGGQLANFIATATTALFPGTNSAYLFSVFLCAVSVAAWFILVKNKNPERDEPGHAAAPPAPELLKVVLRSGNVWIMGLCMLFNIGFFLTVTSSVPSALQSIGYSLPEASLISSALSVGSPAGLLLGSFLAVKSGKPKRFMQIVIAVTALTVPFAWKVPNPVFGVAAMATVGFANGACQATIMSMLANLPEIGHKYAGTAGGLMTTVQMIGSVIIPSRILAPAAGGDYVRLFFLAAASLGISFVLTFRLGDPAFGSEHGRKAS
jgi:NNP family nitrate/nitrite transporter-like MFS transporter